MKVSTMTTRTTLLLFRGENAETVLSKKSVVLASDGPSSEEDITNMEERNNIE